MKKYLINILLIVALLFIPKLLFAEEPDSLKIELKYPFKVDSIKISGNETTKDYIILRELSFSIGDTVNNKIIDFNRERIFSLRIFNAVDFIPKKENDLNLLEIHVDESWYIYPVPFLYFRNNDFNKSIYGIDFKYKNFRGINETLILNFSLGYDPSVSLQYLSPAFDYENAISLNGMLSIKKISNKSDKAEYLYGGDFNYNSYFAYIQIGKRIDQFNSIYSSISYTYLKGPDNSTGKLTASGSSVDKVISLGLMYVHDTRDLVQFAKDGMMIQAQLVHKGFGVNDINYNIASLDFRKYMEFFDTFTAKIRFLGRHTFGPQVPYYDYSYLGFDEIIRGYSQKTREGNNSALSSLEISVPIFRDWEISVDLPLLPTKLTTARIDVHIYTFGDTGLTFDNNENISLKNFDSGFGCGLAVLFLPHNALRFEYALNEHGKGEFIFGTGFSF